jgi:nicotinamidase-related amidase
MGDQLLPLPLTERSVHLCVDMQRIFLAEGFWRTPWTDRVLTVAVALANRHPEQSVFIRFIPPERPDQMPGMWRRYYTRWRVATRECHDPRLLELMQLLAAPPAPSSTKHAISRQRKTRQRFTSDGGVCVASRRWP